MTREQAHDPTREDQIDLTNSTIHDSKRDLQVSRSGKQLDTGDALSMLNMPEQVDELASKANSQAIDLEDILPVETIAVLRKTSQKYFRVRAFTKEVNGTQRSVVVLGERHFKNKEAFEQGERIIERFKYRGLEGADLGKYWAGKLLTGIMESYKFIGSKVFRIKSFEKGSTIDSAGAKDAFQSLKDAIVKVIVPIITQNNLSLDDRKGWNKIEALELFDKKYSMDGVSTIRISVNNFDVGILTGEEILKEAFALAGQTKQGDVVSLDRGLNGAEVNSRTFPLEESHQPTLKEQLGVVFIPIVFASSATFITCSLTYAEGPIITPVKWIAGGLGVLGSSAFIAGNLLSKKFYDAPWLPYLQAGLAGALVADRNKTIVTSTNQVFEDNAEVDTLLAVVGRGHVPGMSKLLVEKHGWKELDVPGQEVGY